MQAARGAATQGTEGPSGTDVSAVMLARCLQDVSTGGLGAWALGTTPHGNVRVCNYLTKSIK